MIEFELNYRLVHVLNQGNKIMNDEDSYNALIALKWESEVEEIFSWCFFKRNYPSVPLIRSRP